MLHELLLALSGDSGGVFVYKKFAGLQVCVGVKLNFYLAPNRQYFEKQIVCLLNIT